MTERSTLDKFFIGASTYWAVFARPHQIRWMLWTMFWAIAFLVSLKAGFYPHDEPVNGVWPTRDPALTLPPWQSFARWTMPWSYILAAIFLFELTFGLRKVRRINVYQRDHGVPVGQGSLFEEFTGRVARPQPEAPSMPVSAPVVHDSVLIVPTTTATGKAREIEDHGDFTVVDRRKYAHLVDEYYTGER